MHTDVPNPGRALSPGPLHRLAALALQIAAVPPERRDGHGAQVPWRLVLELREQLEALGIDWRDFKRQAESGEGAR